MSQPKCRVVIVNNTQGIHARPADLIAKTARNFESTIVLAKGAERVDGKSILSILTLAALPGTELEIVADGQDAEQALDALAELFERNFEEDHQTNET